MDEARLASPEVGQPQHVDAGRVDDTAVVPEVAPSVEHGQVEPRVVGPETRRPDDGAHVAAELDPEPRRGTDLRGLVAMSESTSALVPFVSAHSSNSASSRFILRSASAQTLPSEPENCALQSRMPARRPTSCTPCVRSTSRSSVSRSGVPTSCGEGTRRARRIVRRLDALVEHAASQHPPLHVAAPIDARHSHVLADGQRHGPAAGSNLLRRLQASRRRADHEHPPSSTRPGLR